MASFLRNAVRFTGFSVRFKGLLPSSILISTHKLRERISYSFSFSTKPLTRKLSSSLIQDRASATQLSSEAESQSSSDVNRRSIFVSSLRTGLNYTNEETLENFFSNFGEVEHVHLIRTKLSEQSRGLAVIRFKEEQSLQDVLRYNVVHIDNRPIKLAPYVPRDEEVDVQPTVGIFVSDVAKNTSEDEITTHFSQFGKIERVVLPLHSSTRERKGFCFVIFSSVNEAKKALAVPEQKVAAQSNYSEIKVARESAVCLGKTKKIAVEPIPSSMTVDVVQQYCESYGRVLSVDILVYASAHHKYPRSIGVAYVYFASEEAVEKIVQDTVHTLAGTTVCVMKSTVSGRKQLTPNRDCKVSVEGLEAQEPGIVEEHFLQTFEVNPKKVTFLSANGPCLVDFWKASDVEKVTKVTQQKIGEVDVNVRRLSWNRRVEEGFLRHKTAFDLEGH